MARASVYPGWFALAVAFLIQLVASGPLYYGFSVFSGVFTREFQASRASVNAILTLVTLFSGFAGVPIGWLLQRFSVRFILLSGALAQVGGLTMVAAASSFAHVLVGYGIVAGVADALLSVQVTNLLVVHWFERRRGLAMGIAVTSTSLAGILYPPLLTWLVETIGWRATFVVAAGALFLLLPLIAWKARVPDEIPLVERTSGREASVRQKTEMASETPYRTADFWIVTGATGAMFSANLVIISALVSYTRSEGFSAYQAAALLSLQGMVALLAKVGFGIIADRMRPNYGLAVACGLGALSMLFWLIGGSFVVLAIAAILFGLCLGGTLPMFGVILARRFGLADYAMVVGASRTAQAPLMLGMPLLTGWLFDLAGDWRPTFALLLMILSIATIASLLARLAPPTPGAR